MKKERHIVHSLGAFREVVFEFTQKLQGGEVIALVGDLGAGKTTFVQSLAENLGVQARVKSPTFALMQEYEVSGHASIRRLLHLDLYRFTKGADLSELGLEDEKQGDTVICIEWANMANTDALGITDAWELKILDEQAREMNYEKRGE